MRLFEIVSPRFYLVTSSKKPMGSKVACQGTVHPLGALLEGRLEATRPSGQLARTTSLYLHPDQPSHGEYVYEVAVVDTPVRHHTSWLKQLKSVSSSSVGAVDHFCRAYWSGKECPEERDLPWEYRATEAIILRRVGGAALMKVK